MRNLVTLFIIFIALLQPARSICAEDYYQTGYKYGKNLGWDVGSKERTRCVEQHRDPISIKEAWKSTNQNQLISLFLKEQGIDPNPKTVKDKQLFIQIGNKFIKLLQNDTFGKGLADGFAEGYFSRTKDALYKGLCDKQLFSFGRMSDWDQGYIDGHNHAWPIGFGDKRNGNPTNWLDRYFEVNFRYLDSNDAQYLDGFRQGFKAGYLSGYR